MKNKISQFITEEELIKIIISSAKDHERLNHTFKDTHSSLSKLKKRYCKNYLGLTSVLAKINIESIILNNTKIIKLTEQKIPQSSKPVPKVNVSKISKKKKNAIKKQEDAFNNRQIKTTDTDFISSIEFLQSYEWRRLRLQALLLHGRQCQCCGASPETGAVLNIDHIKPRKNYPELALVLSNLQVLCHECNHGKGNWCEEDFRPKIKLDIRIRI